MTENRFVRYLIYISLWPVVILVYPRIQGLAAFILWWMSSHSGATTLSRPAFAGEMWLPIAALDGFILGLIPLAKLLGWVAHSSGYLSYRTADHSATHATSFQPASWGWVAPTVASVIRFATFDTHRDSSILGAATLGDSRIAHFFGPPPPFSFSLSSLEFYSDRLYLISPMLFLLAFAIASRLRRRLIELRDARAEDSPSSLINSSPIHFTPESTETLE